MTEFHESTLKLATEWRGCLERMRDEGSISGPHNWRDGKPLVNAGLVKRGAAPGGVRQYKLTKLGLAVLAALPPHVECEGCPPIGYPTDETRCTPCPRRKFT